MLKRHMALCLIATTLGAAPALAQSTTGSSTSTTGSPTNPSASMSDKSGMTKPDANNSSMNSGMNNPGTKTNGAAMNKSGNAATMNKTTAQATSMNHAAMKPMAAPGPGQVLGSDLEGTRVYGSNNENVGDISDTLIDRNGQVVAVVVGVGGFLGIGEKDVAIPFNALEIVPQNASASAGGSGAMGGGTASAPAKTTGTKAANASEQGTMNPTKIVLRGMTKADLEKAPAFDPDADVDADNAAGATTTR